MLGDKEITVRIRSNSHYRIFIRIANESSRNACRSVIRKSLLGSLGEIVIKKVRIFFGRTLLWQDNNAVFTVPLGGYFYFILLQKKKG
jgi:hypothetical protein